VLGKDLVSIADLSADDIARLLDLAADLKSQRLPQTRPLQSQVLALIFQKPSLRTRVSFEVGMEQLGGRAIYLSNSEVRLGEREGVSDVARVLSRMVNGIVARTYFHSDVVELAEAASIPVINGLSDDEHPCQVLADLLTMREQCGRLRGLKLAWVGDGSNVVNSLLLAAPRVGLNLYVATPPGYEPDGRRLAAAADEAADARVELEVVNDPQAAVQNADFVYTDAWYSMGQEEEREARLPVFRPYQVNAALLEKARPGARVMHCLPAHRGEEITDEVLDGPASIALEQAENRVHLQKAILLDLMARAEARALRLKEEIAAS
jgi:ornithine carbamoyltransferase